MGDREIRIEDVMYVYGAIGMQNGVPGSAVRPSPAASGAVVHSAWMATCLLCSGEAIRVSGFSDGLRVEQRRGIGGEAAAVICGRCTERFGAFLKGLRGMGRPSRGENGKGTV